MARSGEVIDHTLYDTIYLPSAVYEHTAQAFIYPVGQSVFTKNGRYSKQSTDTNLLLMSQLEAPLEFSVKSIECLLYGQTGILGITSRWYGEIALHFSVLNKNYFQAPLAKCAGLAALTAGRTGFLTTEQLIELKKAYTHHFDIPVYIGPHMYFTAHFKFSDWQDGDFGLYPDKLVVMLNGQLIRPEV